MKSSTGKTLKTISLLFMICCMVVLFGCGKAKHPKADLEVTVAAVNVNMYFQFKALVKCASQGKVFIDSDIADDYKGKLVRIKGYVASNFKSSKSGKPVIVFEKDRTKISGGQLVCNSVAYLKDDMSFLTERKVSNKEEIVIQGILKERIIKKDSNDLFSYWRIEDAVIIDKDDFNTDGKADVIIKDYNHRLYERYLKI